MKTLLCLLFLLLPLPTLAKDPPLKVAVIDTGLDVRDARFAGHICETGNINMADPGTSPTDTAGHGTHVAGLIQANAGSVAKYCLMILKYYDERLSTKTNVRHYLDAVEYAINNGAKVINYSGGGPEYLESEYKMIRDSKVLFVTAAGNLHANIDRPDAAYYPAAYLLPNIIAVGSASQGAVSVFSNFGNKVTAWEDGNLVLSYAIRSGSLVLSGTSMAAAIHTGKLVKQLYEDAPF